MGVNGGSLTDYSVRLKEAVGGSASGAYYARVDKTTSNAFSGYVEISMTFSATASVYWWSYFQWYAYISTPSRTLASDGGSASAWNRRLAWSGALNGEKVTFIVRARVAIERGGQRLAERHGRQARAKPDHGGDGQRLPVRGPLRSTLTENFLFFLFPLF